MKNLLFLNIALIILFNSSSSFAQEYQRVHPTYNTGEIEFLHISPSGKSFGITSCGIFLKGNDSGKTWTEHELPLGFRTGFTHLYYLDNQETKIILQSQYDFLYSDNGGDTWEKRRPDLGGFNRDIEQMDNGEFFLGGFSENKIAITGDHGLTWETDSLDFYTNQYSAIGNGIIYAGNRDGMVAKSTNYGRDWSIVKEEEPSGFYSNLHFTDEMTGFRVVSSRMESTTDGGLTWEVAHTGTIASGITYIDDVTFISRSTQLYYVTTDAGKNWQLKRYGEGRPVIYTGIHANSANEVWAYGLNMSILSSDNPEETNSWKILDDDIFIYHITDIAFYNAEKGVACDNGGNLFVTEDGGDTWNAYKTLGDRPNSLCYNSNGEIIISTQSRGLIKTTDFQNYDSLGLSGIDFNYMASSGNVIYGLASSGLYKSVDDGDTWNEILSKNTLRYISILDENKVFVSLRDSMYKSLNGGQTWEGLPVTNIVTLAAASEDLIYFHCTDSIRVTNDGGLTVNAVARKPRNTQELKLGKENELFVFGHSGTATNQGIINRSIDGGVTWPTAQGDDGCVGVLNMTYNKATEEMWFAGAGGNIMRFRRSTSNQEQYLNTASLNVFPNPSDGYCTIEVPQVEQSGRLHIFNQIGQQVFQKEIFKNQEQEVLEIQEPGFYLVHLTKGSNRYISKVIVNK